MTLIAHLLNLQWWTCNACQLACPHEWTRLTLQGVTMMWISARPLTGLLWHVHVRVFMHVHRGRGASG